MFRNALVWFGFTQSEGKSHVHHHGRDHGHGGKHAHTHGVIDPTIATSERGIWAIKWSFVILAITAALQLTVVFASGSVALLADTIHNIGDSVTAIPLWIAFKLVRRKPSVRFPGDGPGRSAVESSARRHEKAWAIDPHEYARGTVDRQWFLRLMA